MGLKFILLLLAFIVFGISAFNVPSPRFNLIGLGLALVTLAQLVA